MLSRFTDPTGCEHAPGMAHYDGANPPMATRHSPDAVTVDPDAIGPNVKRAPSGSAARWSSALPDPSALPQSDVRVTRSRKRGASFVATGGAAHLRTVGDVHAIDPVLDLVRSAIVSNGPDDDAYGVTREARLVAEANAWLAGSEGQRIVSPMGNVTTWDTEHKLGGLNLTDTPYSRSRSARMMRQQIIGGKRERGIADDMVVDPATWCSKHETEQGRCGCVHTTEARLTECARHRDELRAATPIGAGPGWYGFTGDTSVADAYVVRASVGAPSRSKAYAAVDVLHEVTNDAGKVVRKVRGIRMGKVTHLLGWIEHVDADGKVTRVPMVGHQRLTIERKGSGVKRETTKAGRDAARESVVRVADRRTAFANELAALLAPMPVGASATVDHDGATVTLARTRRDRYAVNGWSAGSPAAVAIRAARELVSA